MEAEVPANSAVFFASWVSDYDTFVCCKFSETRGLGSGGCIRYRHCGPRRRWCGTVCNVFDIQLIRLLVSNKEEIQSSLNIAYHTGFSYTTIC